MTTNQRESEEKDAQSSLLPMTSVSLLASSVNIKGKEKAKPVKPLVRGMLTCREDRAGTPYPEATEQPRKLSEHRGAPGSSRQGLIRPHRGFRGPGSALAEPLDTEARDHP